MEGKRLIHSIRLKNLLSFGEEAEPLELEPLNVLIGPNMVGKSNFIEALGLLKAAPTDITRPIAEGGGIADWMWKGEGASGRAEIEVVVEYPKGHGPLRYGLAFSQVGQRMEIVDEDISDWLAGHGGRAYYSFRDGDPIFIIREKIDEEADTEQGRTARRPVREELNPAQSALSQRKAPDQYPELTHLVDQFSAIRLYREWSLGRYAAPRLPQPADLPGDFLEDDARNLGLVVNEFLNRPGGRELLLKYLKAFCDEVTDVSTRVHGGTVQIFFHEAGMNSAIPATRVSDGMLRFLCLTTILIHPEPPPLICIEEPELGLHTDMLKTVAEMLIDAAQRTQIVVTTHSADLVSALSDVPEAVIVCEKGVSGTRLKRLEPEKLKNWLSEYDLGDVWASGEIGGNRW